MVWTANQLTVFYMMATLAFNELRFFNSFKKGGLYNIEISKPCKANQWTALYMIGTSVMKELTTLSNKFYRIRREEREKFLTFT